MMHRSTSPDPESLNLGFKVISWATNLSIITFQFGPLLIWFHSKYAICLHMLPGGGTLIIFWQGVQPKVWNPYPYLRIFSPSNNGWFQNFLKSGPISKGFSTSKMDWFTIFVKWDPLLRIFLTKNGPMSKDFWWKSNPFGWHIPVCLNMLVTQPPPPPAHPTSSITKVAQTMNNLVAVSSN